MRLVQGNLGEPESSKHNPTKTPSLATILPCHLHTRLKHHAPNLRPLDPPGLFLGEGE
jgi:hypothetical protein